MAGDTLTAYKFLASGGVGPFSGIVWPQPANGEPGTWVERDDGISACEARHLPMWIREELWEVELDGAVRPIAHKLLASRARLARRVDAWSPELAGRFAQFCVDRAEQHASRADADIAEVVAGMLGDASTAAQGAVMSDDPALASKASAGAAYVTAMIARRVSGPPAFDAERDLQADWLTRELDLR
jgi:hypothetical protein